MTVGRRWTQTTSDVANGTDEPGVRAAGGRAGGLRGAFLRLRRQSLWVACGSGDGVCFRPSGESVGSPGLGTLAPESLTSASFPILRLQLYLVLTARPRAARLGPGNLRSVWGRGASLSSETRRAAPAVTEGRSQLSVVRALILGTRERRPFSPREGGRPARAAFTGDVTTLSARRCVSVHAELIYAFPCSPRGSS